MIPYKELLYAWCYVNYIKYTIDCSSEYQILCFIFLVTRTLKSFIKVSESVHDK